MANMPQIIPGGRIDPTMSGMSAELTAKLVRKQEEEKALREDLHAKEETLRQGLKQWDELSRNSENWRLKTELSEKHVRALAGESVGGAAF